MKFFLGLFFVVLFIVTVLGPILGKIIRFMRPGNDSSRYDPKSTNSRNSSNTGQRKQFSKDEGEYVNYEEIKEE